MKLIERVAIELEVWPASIGRIYQAENGDLIGSGGFGYQEFIGNYELSDDRETSVVTRLQWQAGRDRIMGMRTPEERQSLKDQICEQIAEGINLREICRQEGMPTWRSVYDWMYADEEFASAIARAREVGYHAIAAESLAIADEEPERIISEQGAKIDPGYVAWQKLRVEHRLKLLAKWSPKLYGDKIAIGGADDLPALKTQSDTDIDARIAALMAANAKPDTSSEA